jgi:uncharacterized protein YaaR (DUF327 family)
MPRIDPLRPGVRAASRSAQARKGGTAPAKQGTRAAGIPRDLSPLVEEIDAAGEELKRDHTGRSFTRYRDAVQRFLDAAVADSMGISSEASLGLANKVFSTVTRVNIVLADLTDAVIGRQPDLLKTMQLVEQVKGLIVDLYN